MSEITTSRVVRAVDFEQPWFKRIAGELGEQMNLHRKLWEFCAIAQVYQEQVGSANRPARALGFGVGREPLAAWFAAQGASVIATDRPDATREWADTGQHAASLADLRRPAVCDPATFDERVRFLFVDMNAIPANLKCGLYDFTWSSGSFEHIGSLDRGINFFCEQMKCLRPGGIAAHTTEFNPHNDEPTLNAHDIVLYRQDDLFKLMDRLTAQGDALWPLDLERGNTPADAHIDRPPYGLPHLRIIVTGMFVTTSILLVARRGHA
jgi:SAM-dependent methyltransferase